MRPPTRGRRGFIAALRAEWVKQRTLPGTPWWLFAIIVLTTALSLMSDSAARCPSAGCGLDPARTTLLGVYLGQAVVAVLAVLCVSNEYSSGMVKVTFAAVPCRARVLAAKAVVLAGLIIPASALAVLVSVLAGQLVLPSHGFTAAHGYGSLSLSDGAMLRAATGTVLYLTLIGLLSLGVATVMRHGAAAIGTVLALLYVVPIIATSIGVPRWQRHVEQIAPMTAGMAVQATTSPHPLPISPWAGLGVLSAWAAAALLAGALDLRLRDA